MLPNLIHFGVAGLKYVSCRATYSHGLEITADRWFLLFSLLSAATAGPPGRPFVWSALTLLLENDLICETNYTASRHLVLRFAHG